MANEPPPDYLSAYAFAARCDVMPNDEAIQEAIDKGVVEMARMDEEMCHILILFKDGSIVCIYNKRVMAISSREEAFALSVSLSAYLILDIDPPEGLIDVKS